MNQVMSRARGMMSGFTPGQRGVIAVAAIALVLGAFALSRWAAQPSWTPLFSNLSGSDANAVVEQLRAENVPYQLGNGGSTVLVPQAQVYDLRVTLAGKNLPAGDSGGWSLMDKQGMTATDFQQNVAYQRALEGELSSTLQAISGVRTAVVHLAIPKKDVFTTEQDKPTSSVLLALQPGVSLGPSQVRSVTHLVAGSVPGLEPEQVTVTDGNGVLLSSPDTGPGGGGADLANLNDAQTAQFENRVGGSLQKMLDTVLGPGNAVVRVNAELDYGTKETTTQGYEYRPGVPPLSEKASNETFEGTGGGAGGALGQGWPNPVLGTGGTGESKYKKKESTVNNAVGSTVTKVNAAPGGVKRMTVAVVLDAATAAATQSGDVEQLVSNAVGLDRARGDSVEISTIPFDRSAAARAQKEVADVKAEQARERYVDLGTKAAIGLVVLAALLLAARKRRRTGTRIEAVATDLPAQGQLLLTPEMQAMLAGGPSARAITQEAEDTARQRERMREEVSAFVDRQPEEIAQLVQGWLGDRRG